MRISDYFLFPTLASIMEKRREALILGGVAVLQFGLVTAGFPGWPCPFKAALGIPCPACGVSTSISYLLHGDWHGALSTHAFAPLLLLGLAFVLIASLLPQAAHAAVIQKITLIEKKTGITTILMAGMIFYWGFRLLKL